MAHSFRNGYTALAWVSNGYASHGKLHREEEGKCREQISRHIFFLDTLFTSKCGLQIFQTAAILQHAATQCCIHNVLTWISRMMLSTSIQGGDLKTISPGDYITCQSSLQDRKLSPHFGMGRGKGQLTAACPPSLNVCFSTGSFCNMNFHSNQQKLKPVQKKHTHIPSSLFSLGKVQNCKKTEKYCTSV